MQENQQSNTSLVVSGYIISFLPVLLLPIVFTPVGIILGVINISKNESGHGIAQILIAIICGIIGAHLGGAGFGLPRM